MTSSPTPIDFYIIFLLLRKWILVLSYLYDLCVECGVQNVNASPLLDSFTDVAYVGSAVLFIFSILGLSQQESARAGNW